MEKSQVILKQINVFANSILELTQELESPTSVVTSDMPLLIQVLRKPHNYIGHSYSVSVVRIANALSINDWDLLPVNTFVQIISKKEVASLRNVSKKGVDELSKIIKDTFNLDWE